MREHLLKIAKRRQEIHRNRSSRNVWMAKNPVEAEYRGLVGEEDYGKIIGRKPNLEEKPMGDQGVDFFGVTYILTGGWPFILDVDVRTILPHHKLVLHQVGHQWPDVIVIMEFSCDEARPVGWAWACTIESIKPQRKPKNMLNHCMPRDWLKPMRLLQPKKGKQA